MKRLRVLIACECSQTVCAQFRALGDECYSCDIVDQSRKHGGREKRRQTQIWPPARRVSRHAGARLGARLTLDKNDGNAPGVVCTQEI